MTLTSLPATTSFFNCVNKTFLKFDGRFFCFSSMNLVIAYWLEPVFSFNETMASLIISKYGGCREGLLGFPFADGFLAFFGFSSAAGTSGFSSCGAASSATTSGAVGSVATIGSSVAITGGFGIQSKL